MLAVGFSYMAFIILRNAPSIPTSLSIFTIHVCCTLSNAFQHLLISSCDFSFILFMWCITFMDLGILYHPCIPGMNPTWSWCMIFSFFFFKVFCGGFFDIFIDYAITVVPFLPLHSTPPCPPPPSHISSLYFMSMGHTYKIFGFYISYTILTLPLSIFHLSFMLFILCTLPSSLPLPIPYWEPSMWSPFLWFCSCSSCWLSLLLFWF